MNDEVDGGDLRPRREDVAQGCPHVALRLRRHPDRVAGLKGARLAGLHLLPRAGNGHAHVALAGLVGETAGRADVVGGPPPRLVGDESRRPDLPLDRNRWVPTRDDDSITVQEGEVAASRGTPLAAVRRIAGGRKDAGEIGGDGLTLARPGLHLGALLVGLTNLLLPGQAP